MSTESTSNQASESRIYVDLENMPSMDELLKVETKSDFAEGTIIEGKIVEKRNDGVLIDIGYKAEGFVPATEFYHFADVKVGDKVDVFLDEIENENSMPGISLSKAHAIKAWNRITNECGEGCIIKGLMKHRIFCATQPQPPCPITALTSGTSSSFWVTAILKPRPNIT